MTTTTDLEAALIKRGVNPTVVSSLLTGLSTDIVESTIRWYDSESGRVGAGVLVAELRAGGKTPRRSLADRQRDYGDQVCTWLDEHMPQFSRPRWGPHPAAIAAVIRLHHEHGKNGITVGKHGGRIRAAVADFDQRFGL